MRERRVEESPSRDVPFLIDLAGESRADERGETDRCCESRPFIVLLQDPKK